MTPHVPTPKEIATRIRKRWHGLPQHGSSTCAADGDAVAITYAGGTMHRLNQDEALQYLAYLDGGGTGTHLLGKKESDDEG